MTAFTDPALRRLFTAIFGGTLTVCITLTAFAYLIGPDLLDDSEMVAFASRRTDDTELYLLDAARGLHVNLTNSPGYDAEAAWSPDGTQLAFVSARDGVRDVYLMTLPDRTVRNISRSFRANSSPAWSPDGTQIAYTAFSPNVFASERLDQVIVIHTPATGEYRTLPGEFSGNVALSWSPDGELLTFTGQDEDGVRQIYTLDMGDPNATPIPLLDDDGWADYPAWSPDGEQLAFIRVAGNAQLYLADANGDNVRRLTDDRFWHSFPHWSADGEHIVVTTNRDLNNDIYLIDVVTGESRRLTTHPGDDYDPAWRP